LRNQDTTQARLFENGAHVLLVGYGFGAEMIRDPPQAVSEMKFKPSFAFPELCVCEFSLYHKFVMAGIVDQHFGSRLAAPHTVESLKELESPLWAKVGMLQ